MRYGTVVKYVADKGFGFIKDESGPDVFFHVSALGACQEEPEIEEGQAVKYELYRRAELPQPAKPGERKAKLVELIDQIPGGTLDEGPSPEASARHPRARRKKPTWRR